MPHHDPVPRKRGATAPLPPSAIRYGKEGRARRCYSPNNARWTERKEAAFLDALAQSGNIKWSAAQVNVHPSTPSRHRRNNAAFAAKWEAALEDAFAMLEFELVTAARKAISGLEFPAELRIKPMSAADAIRVLSMYKASLARGGRRAGPEALPREMEELRESILKKVRAIRNGRKPQN